MDALYVACAIFLVLIIFLYYQNNIIDVTHYNIGKENISGSITIAHLSDLHSKPFHKAVRITAKNHPDLIVITGDYINDRGKNKEKMIALGKDLLAIAPVIYITGNHERRLNSFEELMAELKEIGFTVLLNETVSLNINENAVNVLGLDENQADFEDYKARKNGTFVYKDLSPYFKELCSREGYRLVLSHFPENFEGIQETNYSQYDFDLQLSGHAHGGQFILPLIGPVFSPGQGFKPKYARGSFGDKPKLIVSRGLGNAEFPFRLFNHPQINIIKILKTEI